MPTHAGVLRQARDTVMPQVPDLAPQLAESPTIIMDALNTALDEQGVDPHTIAPININKAERHTIIGYVGNKMRDLFVEGTDRDAQIRDYQPPFETGSGNLYFLRHVRDLQERAASRTKNYYTSGDQDHQWWPLAADRYARLGQLAASLGDGVFSIPYEGKALMYGLQTGALTSFGGSMLAFVRENMSSIPADERPGAAHDIIHFMTIPAGMHFKTVTSLGRILDGLKIDIVKDSPDAAYRIKPQAGSRGLKRPTDEALDTATLKCPLHTRMIMDEDFGLPPQSLEPIGDIYSPETNLRIMMHGLINAGARSGFFSQTALSRQSTARQLRRW
jgi:hypothetical protein